MTKYVKNAHSYLTSEQENLQIDYVGITGETEEEIKQKLLKELERVREKDIKLGYTNVGPHRDDIKFLVNNIDIRNFGSQGQHRTVALSLKLAELEIFKEEKPIIPAEEWFSSELKIKNYELRMPPAGAGDCCAPKLLQYALTHGLEPVSLAEFWVGAPSKTEIRQEGAFYAPCSGKCGPILKHVLQGLDIEDWRLEIGDWKKPETIFEDDYLMVVNKPAGLLSVSGKGEEPSVESLMGAKPVHRLDQDTSGLLVLAKTAKVYKELQSYFQRRDILKRYEAVLRPNDEMCRLRLNDGMIELPLLPNPYDRPRQMVDQEHGKVAITKYVIRERRNDGTMLVDFYPLTGRTHQLRVHAAHPEGLNAPIVGDRLYGKAGERLMLHAAEIRFVHPITKEEMHFCIPSNF